MEEVEIWIDVPDYENKYQVSDLGNVKSLNFNGTKKSKLLKKSIDHEGRFIVGLCSNGKRTTFKVHHLVSIAFLNHKADSTQKIVIDHIDNNPLNNRLDNLQLITQRKNTSKDKINKTSIYTGVSFDNSRNKWFASIKIKNKSIFLGRFINEIDAHLAYENKLLSLN